MSGILHLYIWNMWIWNWLIIFKTCLTCQAYFLHAVMRPTVSYLTSIMLYRDLSVRNTYISKVSPGLHYLSDSGSKRRRYTSQIRYTLSWLMNTYPELTDCLSCIYLGSSNTGANCISLQLQNQPSGPFHSWFFILIQIWWIFLFAF